MPAHIALAFLLLVLCIVAIAGVSNVALMLRSVIGRPLSIWTPVSALIAILILSATVWVAANVR